MDEALSEKKERLEEMIEDKVTKYLSEQKREIKQRTECDFSQCSGVYKSRC